jgi:hypothetical protein
LLQEEGLKVAGSVQADAKFLRRVLLGLVLMTVVTGGMAGFTTVQAMTEQAGHCILFCQ